jgi:hypothetical protein
MDFIKYQKLQKLFEEEEATKVEVLKENLANGNQKITVQKHKRIEMKYTHLNPLFVINQEMTDILRKKVKGSIQISVNFTTSGVKSMTFVTTEDVLEQ